MSRLIVHTGTGTIVDASECVLVDTDLFDDHDMARLSGDDYFDDSVIVEIAERCGVAVPDAGDAARWNALDLATGVGGRWCASCELVGDETEIDPMSSAVVSWAVMGDTRSYAFVCDECASGSAVVCERCGDSEDVQGGLCAACFEAAPVGVWF